MRVTLSLQRIMMLMKAMIRNEEGRNYLINIYEITIRLPKTSMFKNRRCEVFLYQLYTVYYWTKILSSGLDQINKYLQLDLQEFIQNQLVYQLSDECLRSLLQQSLQNFRCIDLLPVYLPSVIHLFLSSHPFHLVGIRKLSFLGNSRTNKLYFTIAFELTFQNFPLVFILIICNSCLFHIVIRKLPVISVPSRSSAEVIVLIATFIKAKLFRVFPCVFTLKSFFLPFLEHTLEQIAVDKLFSALPMRQILMSMPIVLMSIWFDKFSLPFKLIIPDTSRQQAPVPMIKTLSDPLTTLLLKFPFMIRPLQKVAYPFP